MVKSALLEIGHEEIPASYLEPARTQVSKITEEYLQSSHITFNNIKTFATPRRLAVYIDGLEEKSKDRTEEHVGPSVASGRDIEGNFTMAAKGFANKHNLSVEKLIIKNLEKGEYFCAQKKVPGEKTEKILKDMFIFLLNNISFPKSMIWEPSCFRFARPIRTLVALYGNKQIKIAIADVKSANWTFGLHTAVKKRIIIGSAEKYLTTLKNNCIIADPEERKSVLKKIIESTAKRVKGLPYQYEELLDEVDYLVEHPVAVLGRFNEKYVNLPQEILVNCMQKKQKYFPVINEKGNLTNYFIGIRNGVSKDQDIVKEGYERVLTARLEDAEFFFSQDTRKPLESRVEKLKGVIFQEKLGTVNEKIERIKKLAIYIHGSVKNTQGINKENNELIRAATLCKADLVTDMVFEYPELQGVIGRIYAKKDGESPNVYNAIEQHYWPLTSDGKLPETSESIILSLADKIDTLVGNFAIGVTVKGSADPYGLRRLSAGIIRIIKEKRLSLKTSNLVEKAFSFMPQNVKNNQASIVQIIEFMRQRTENIFQSDGYRFDEVRAVLSAGYDDIVDVSSRLDALRNIRRQPDFEPLAVAFKRAANILKQAHKMKISVPDNVLRELTKDESEKNLLESVCRIENDIKSFLDNKDYYEVLQRMVEIKPNVDEFFDKVMVMTDDETLRANRLAILNYTTKLFFKILDFSLLQ